MVIALMPPHLRNASAIAGSPTEGDKKSRFYISAKQFCRPATFPPQFHIQTILMVNNYKQKMNNAI